MTLAALQRHTDLVPVVRTVNRGFAPLWLTTIVALEVAEDLDAIGLTPEKRYAAARSAPLCKAPLPLVVASFFNFSPAAIGRAIPSAWESTTPEAVLAAQLRGRPSAPPGL